ncbi:hypothetical protein ACHCAK_20610 [Raoultella ornithinolytica]|uniref:hypothetical protein n=1 Tax=Raoultella TaxID=160674 RepID=UPI00062BB269|nr:MULTISPECIES: hypothetical protein [Raoultella]EKQ8000899.1 hypothetical protein [Raoultella ornithinolytica]EKU0199767.1 hypothetical protein [Raoultella ornithinolytica]EKV4103755.1 hypothetical protein [Raoultella ornithinolytica]EKV8287134.1 hypothetical protein [Raoultella ornithinolytica]EKW3194539.1 hypothetical protein [Raoultella ornithinolytica]
MHPINNLYKPSCDRLKVSITRSVMEELQKSFERMSDLYSKFFDFIDNFKSTRVVQKLSVKNEKFSISIPLIALIRLITRLIVFKIAIMYKVMKHKTMEYKVISKMTKNQHCDLLALNKILTSEIFKENLCQA